MTGQPNVSKRLTYARSAFSDPEQERIFGWILKAVASQDSSWADPWRWANEPPWDKISAALPRRFGPYLPWLGKQVRWWRSDKFERNIVTPWVDLQQSRYEPTSQPGVVRAPMWLSELGIELPYPGAPGRLGEQPVSLLADDESGAHWIAGVFADIVDWAMSKERPDLGQHDLLRAHFLAAKWHASLQQGGRPRVSWVDVGVVEYNWFDGWTLQQLHRDQLVAEGDAMGNCVSNYEEEVDAGDTIFFSLRDPLNQPHIDIEVSTSYGGEWAELPVPTQNRLEAMGPQLKEDAYREGVIDEEELSDLVMWGIDNGQATAWLHGERRRPTPWRRVLTTVDLDLPPRVREVRGRDNKPLTGKHCRRVLEAMLTLYGDELLADEDMWGELMGCVNETSAEDLAELVQIHADQEMPDWLPIRSGD